MDSYSICRDKEERAGNYEEEASLPIRKSHETPHIKFIYDKF
jgi:hypothetical protein